MGDNDLVRRGDVEKMLCDAYDYDMIDEGELTYLISEANKIPAVPQEMSAVEYLKVRERMASKLGELCSACHCEGKCWDCPYHAPDTEDEMKYPDRSVALVEKWAREHPEERSERCPE
jgi:hypothetical protein